MFAWDWMRFKLILLRAFFLSKCEQQTPKWIYLTDSLRYQVSYLYVLGCFIYLPMSLSLFTQIPSLFLGRKQFYLKTTQTLWINKTELLWKCHRAFLKVYVDFPSPFPTSWLVFISIFYGGESKNKLQTTRNIQRQTFYLCFNASGKTILPALGNFWLWVEVVRLKSDSDISGKFQGFFEL